VCPKSDAEQDSAAEIAPPIVPKAPWRVRFAGPAGSWRVYVVFNDDLRGEIDMRGLIYSPNAGVFAALRDVDVFIEVQAKYGAVIWPGDIDLAPEPMYAAIKRTGVYVPRAEPHEPDQSLGRA
jgi:hypothetical protein